MVNPIITDNDLGNVIYESGQFQDDTYESLGVVDLAEGTILGRQTSDAKLGLFNKAGADGLDTQVVVISYKKTPIVIGDNAVRVAISGTVRLERLVIADGDPVVTEVVKDQLRGISIIPVSVIELAKFDNPNNP